MANKQMNVIDILVDVCDDDDDGKLLQQQQQREQEHCRLRNIHHQRQQDDGIGGNESKNYFTAKSRLIKSR